MIDPSDPSLECVKSLNSGGSSAESVARRVDRVYSLESICDSFRAIYSSSGKALISGISIAIDLHTLLSQEKLESALESNALARPLVVGRETGRVSRLGDLALSDLLQGVKAVALGVEGVHQMHCSGLGGIWAGGSTVVAVGWLG